MSAKKKYTRFNTPRGVGIYPRLTEPDTKFDVDGVYTVKLALPADCPKTAKLIEKLEAELEAFKVEFVERDPKNKAKLKKGSDADVYEEEVDDEGEETGRLIFKFKLNAVVRPKGKPAFTQRPRLFDAHNQPIEGDLKMWSGTEMKVSGEIFPYYMESAKQFGLSLRVKAAQILKLVSGGSGGSAEDYGFEEEEDGFSADEVAGDPTVDDADRFQPDGDDTEDDPDF